MRSYWITLVALLVALPAASAPAFAQDKPADFNKQRTKGDDALKAGNVAMKDGKLAEATAKWDEGIATLKQCLELVPNEPGCAYNIACAYSLKKELDTACEWFGKSIDWGFGFDQSINLSWPETDTDLDNIRANPCYTAGMDKMKAMAKTAEEFYSKPVVYIPEAIKSAATMPLLVVLHDGGQTAAGTFEKGPWKKLADELGSALILPSAKVPVKIFPELSPKDGMDWLGADYSANYWKYEKTVAESVSAFKKEHKLDAARVFIAGEGQGGMVAMNVAFFSPGLYKGAVALSAAPALELAKNKLATAAKMGMKLALLLDRANVFGVGTEAATIDKAATTLEGVFKQVGLNAKIERFDRKQGDPAQIHGLLKAALEGLAAPAAPPAPVEAGSTNK